MQDAVAVRLSAYTGLRLGELLALRWSDVDWPGFALTISRAISAGSLIARTSDPVFVRDFLGHSKLATTNRYLSAKLRLRTTRPGVWRQDSRTAGRPNGNQAAAARLVTAAAHSSGATVDASKLDRAAGASTMSLTT